MKKRLLATLSLIVAAGSASATDYQFVGDQSSVESQLCIKAATGVMSLDDVAAVVGVNVDVVDRSVQCNGDPISRFVSQYQVVTPQPSVSLQSRGQRLDAGHANPDAKLCVIAASGDLARLKQATRAQGLSVKRFVKYNRCNDLSVTDFVGAYGNPQAATVLAKYI